MGEGVDKASQVALTMREQEVLALLLNGDCNKAIAAQLTLNVKTVEIYLTSIYQKLGVKNRTHVILWFMRRD